VPNFNTIKNNDKITWEAANTYWELDKALWPSDDMMIPWKTWFGATPSHKDTFINYKPLPKTAGALTEKERFDACWTNSVGVKCEF